MKNVVLPYLIFILSRNQIDLFVPVEQERNILFQELDLIVGWGNPILPAYVAEPDSRGFHDV